MFTSPRCEDLVGTRDGSRLIHVPEMSGCSDGKVAGHREVSLAQASAGVVPRLDHESGSIPRNEKLYFLSTSCRPALRPNVYRWSSCPPSNAEVKKRGAIPPLHSAYIVQEVCANL
jgi:hypothetical protein